MAEPSPDATASAKPPEDRLDSWKEIAVYLSRDVTTVQRWEKREGMPVHRHLHDKMGSVYASRAELDAWVQGRKAQAAPESEESVVPPDPPTTPSTQPKPRSTLPKRGRIALTLAMVTAALAIGGYLWLERKEYFWRSPIAEARYQTITDFDGLAEAAAISRDGQFVAFLSDRDGAMDVWVTQVGSGQFHNLTRGSAPELVNPSIRTLGFSPDGSAVTYWARRQNGSNSGDIGIWAVPTLGGQPKPYLEGVAEFDWSRDGRQLAYHTPGAGDPLFVSEGSVRPGANPIFKAAAGLHSHFPLWAPDAASLYFVQGTLPDKLDVWRIGPNGGATERITSHEGRVSFPVFLDHRTLLYLASDPDRSGPWLYSVDVEHHISHRLSPGLDRYTSLAASADGRRLVVTHATTKQTLWRMPMPITNTPADGSAATRITPNGTGFSPRIASNSDYYVAATGAGDSLWKFSEGAPRELWSGPAARIVGAPAIGPVIGSNEPQVAFSVRQEGKTLLYVIDANGAHARVVADSLELQGAPAWAPDGQSITTAAVDHGIPHLFRVPLDGGSPTALVQEYSVDPAWSPDGSFVLYSGPDVGTTFSVKAVTQAGAAWRIPSLTLTRGARHLTFVDGGRSLVYLRGEIQHKNLWAVDLKSGVERQLTNVAPDFDIRDFDISPDGREVVLERALEHSEVVLLDLPR